MKAKATINVSHGEPSTSSTRTVIVLKDSTKVGKMKKRFEVPFNLECKGCSSVIAEGVRVNAIKRSVGIYKKREIWNYTTECAYCERKIVMERTSHNSRYKVIKGARRKKDQRETTRSAFEPWGKKCSCKISDRIPPGVVEDPTIYDNGYEVALVREEPRYEGDPNPILRSVF